jgi:hypothetical protein
LTAVFGQFFFGANYLNRRVAALQSPKPHLFPITFSYLKTLQKGSASRPIPGAKRPGNLFRAQQKILGFLSLTSLRKASLFNSILLHGLKDVSARQVTKSHHAALNEP